MNGSDDVFAFIGRSYDYYPNTAIQLCALSYGGMQHIPRDVLSTTGLTVVWGPAELKDWDGVSYSRALVAGNDLTGEYFAVIRGTNFESLSSWLRQDFDLATVKPLAALPGAPPQLPADALIAQGTFNGLTDLIRLRDPRTDASLVDFLAALKPRHLYVTGHSLGGTLAPPLFAYLNATIYGGGPSRHMALWSFAGLTPGGAGFNRYFNSLLPDHQEFQWRIQNSLDVAPLCWWSFDGIQRIYDPYGLHWGVLERDLVADLERDAVKAGVGYAPPQSGLVLAGTFDSRFPLRDLWSGQALHQHHPATYQALVQARYPGATASSMPV